MDCGHASLDASVRDFAIGFVLRRFDTSSAAASVIFGNTLGHTNTSFTSDRVIANPNTIVGVEWAVDARGCDPKRLRDPICLRSLCDSIIDDLGLNVVGQPQCHQFPEPGGVTALYLLSESHLACHTYPEYALATFNLYCCRDRKVWPWQERLGEYLGADEVLVQRIKRGGSIASGGEQQ